MRVLDLFCGAGGFSKGFEQECGEKTGYVPPGVPCDQSKEMVTE